MSDHISHPHSLLFYLLVRPRLDCSKIDPHVRRVIKSNAQVCLRFVPSDVLSYTEPLPQTHGSNREIASAKGLPAESLTDSDTYLAERATPETPESCSLSPCCAFGDPPDL